MAQGFLGFKGFCDGVEGWAVFRLFGGVGGDFGFEVGFLFAFLFKERGVREGLVATA